MATYAVGDIHGQAGALRRLLAQVEPSLTPGDWVVFLGDFIDRGPDSNGVLEELVRFRRRAPCAVRCLLGNHEQWLLRTLADPTAHSWLLGMSGWTTVASYSPEVAALLRERAHAAGVELLRGRVALPYERFFALLPASHLELLRALEPFVRTPDAVCVHGGARSGAPVEAQAARSLVWGDASFPDGYDGPDRIVYGHCDDALLGEDGVVRARRNRAGTAWGIDSVARGALTCLRLPDQAVFWAPVVE